MSSAMRVPMCCKCVLSVVCVQYCDCVVCGVVCGVCVVCVVCVCYVGSEFSVCLCGV